MPLILCVCREEAENASELAAADGADPLGVQLTRGDNLGGDALGVQGNQIRRHIHNFDDA